MLTFLQDRSKINASLQKEGLLMARYIIKMYMRRMQKRPA